MKTLSRAALVPVAAALALALAACSPGSGTTTAAAADGDAPTSLTLAEPVHGVGQREQVVGAGLGLLVLGGQPDDLPPARRREPRRVLGAQVVGVRLGVGGERAEDGGAVGVGVGERRARRLAAAGLRALPRQVHASDPRPAPRRSSAGTP